MSSCTILIYTHATAQNTSVGNPCCTKLRSSTRSFLWLCCVQGLMLFTVLHVNRYLWIWVIWNIINFLWELPLLYSLRSSLVCLMLICDTQRGRTLHHPLQHSFEVGLWWSTTEGRHAPCPAHIFWVCHTMAQPWMIAQSWMQKCRGLCNCSDAYKG